MGGLLAKAPFDVSINAHTHRFAYWPKGSVGNNFPVVIGGESTGECDRHDLVEKGKL